MVNATNQNKYKYNTKISSLTIPKNVIQIEVFAFAENKELITIQFEQEENDLNKELIIKDKAFNNCIVLSNVFISNNDNLDELMIQFVGNSYSAFNQICLSAL